MRGSRGAVWLSGLMFYVEFIIVYSWGGRRVSLGWGGMCSGIEEVFSFCLVLVYFLTLVLLFFLEIRTGFFDRLLCRFLLFFLFVFWLS